MDFKNCCSRNIYYSKYTALCKERTAKQIILTCPVGDCLISLPKHRVDDTMHNICKTYIGEGAGLEAADSDCRSTGSALVVEPSAAAFAAAAAAAEGLITFYQTLWKLMHSLSTQVTFVAKCKVGFLQVKVI